MLIFVLCLDVNIFQQFVLQLAMFSQTQNKQKSLVKLSW